MNGVSVTLASTRSRTATKNVATNLEALEKKCVLLKKYAHYSRNDPQLPDNVFSAFLEVSALATQVGGTAQYSEYMRIVTKVFGEEQARSGDTIADFFVGCSRSQPKAGGRVGCEAPCAGNLPTEGYGTLDFCDSHVGIYRDGELVITYSPADRSNNIKIYHSDPSVTLTQEQAQRLHKMQIATVHLTYTGGSVNVTREPIKVADLLSKKNGNKKVVLAAKKNGNKKALQCTKGTKTEKCDSSDKSGWSGAWIVVAIILFIVILIIIYLVVICFRSAGACAVNTVDRPVPGLCTDGAEGSVY